MTASATPSSTPATTTTADTSGTAPTAQGTTGASASATPTNSPGGPSAGPHDLAAGVQYISGLLGGSNGALVALGGGGLGGGFRDSWALRSSDQGQLGSISGSSDPLKTDSQKLHDDLEAIQAKSQVTVAQLTAVRKDFEKIQSEATSPPDQAKVQALTTDIQALNGQLPTATQTTQLQADFTAVLQSQGITDQTLINQTISDISAVVQASGITATDLATIAADQKVLQTDLGSNDANGATGASSGMAFPHGPLADRFGRDPLRGQSGNGPMGGAGAFGRSWTA